MTRGMGPFLPSRGATRRFGGCSGRFSAAADVGRSAAVPNAIATLSMASVPPTFASIRSAMANILKPPVSLPASFDTPSLFLAGSIEMGQAPPWQHLVERALEADAVTILNPRRDEWD